MKNSLSAFLFLVLISQTFAQDDARQNVASLFSGARILKYPASYTTSSSTGMVKNFSPDALIDNSQQKIWCSYQNKSAPFVFEIELVETYIISEFEFNNIVENFAGIGAKEVMIEVSPVKKSPVFSKVLTATLKEKDISKFTIVPSEARIIRLTILSNHGHLQYTELAEFKAWGEPKIKDIQLIQIDGHWNSNWDALTFKQRGTLVDGNYVFNNGVIRFGGIQRNKITYTWVEDVIKRKGSTIMFMNEEGNELIGIWCYDNNWNEYGFWILNRAKGIPLTPYVADIESSQLDIKEIKTETSVVKEIENELKSQKKIVVYGINFSFNSAEILSESHVVLRQILAVLENNPNMKIRIEGHTDDIGSDDYNNRLSLQRAKSVKKFFENAGINSARLQAEGKGETKPVASNDSEMGRSLNRRVEIHLVE